MAALAGRPIVVFGDDWGRNVSSMQHLFRHIARDYPVTWVNAIGHRVPTLKPADLRRIGQKLRAVASRRPPGDAGIIEFGAAPKRVIQPRVLPWHHLAPVRAFNARSLSRAVKEALRAQGMLEPPLLVTGTPPSVAVLGRLGEIASVYLCMDDFLHLPGVSSWMLAPLERELLQRVDATVATARALTESKRPASGRSYYLPQGVNFEHFSAPRAIPAELLPLPRPLIGFAGTVMSPVDIALLRRLAEEWPGGSLVLVGPVRMDVTAIQRPNVHVFGQRPYRDLPAWVQAFDVGLIPYQLNEHSLAVDPLKLLEYLAAGVPVVTTDLPEVRKYSSAVAIAPGHDDFAAAVRAAIERPRGNRESRQAVARQHGWDSRAADLVRIFEEVLRPA